MKASSGSQGLISMSDEETGTTQLLHEKRDSITLKRNAAGKYAWDIKLYFEAESQETVPVLADIEDIDAFLRGKYL